MIKELNISANELARKDVGEIIKEKGIKDEDVITIHVDTDGCGAIEYLVLYKEKE